MRNGRNAQFWWILAVAWIAGALACRQSEQEPTVLERSYRFLSADTSILIAARVDAFAETETFARTERRILETPGLGSVLRRSGKTLREAVDWVVVGIVEEEDSRPTDLGRLLVLVHTGLEPGFLEEAVRSSGESFRSVEVGSVVVWLVENEGETLAVSEVAPGFLALGSVEEVRRAAQRALGHATALTPTSRLFQDIEAVPAEAVVWGVFDVTPTVTQTLNRTALLAGMESVHHIVWTGTLETPDRLQVALDAYCANADDSQTLESSLQTLVGLAAMTPSDDPALRELLESTRVRAQGARVRVQATVSLPTAARWLEALR